MLTGYFFGVSMPDLWKRITFSFRCFFSILFRGQIAPDITRELGAGSQVGATAPAAAKPAEKMSESCDRAVQMLALLQRDGRLIDFLTEDVSPYPDEQLGAAVRNIHESCRQVIQRYMSIEPVIGSAEDQPVTVEPGFDPAAIKLMGNVTGELPIKGVLRHRGWRVKKINLPTLPQSSGRMVIAPAEVEVNP
jgi:hypothetical protein